MKVYLVGAGPGDPGLITVRGREILSRADVVIHDYLASPALLGWARPDAEVVYVGKKSGAHTLSQERINELLIAKAREGKTVARLKGGDPYIFGRGGEEALALLDAGVPFEEVPGISSTVAGPAYAGIPLTHRHLASSVTIITGHEDADKHVSAHDWPALVRSASTLVFVMGMKHLETICQNLMDNGLDPATPSAVIHWATTPRHRSLTAPLAELPVRAREAGLENPSVIVVGQVVSLRDRLNWFERRPLLGLGVVVTRAREQASELALGLEALGARVVQFPAIHIRSLADTEPVAAAVTALDAYDWIVFTSANGVKHFWQGLAGQGLDARALAGRKMAAVGPATAQALSGRGILTDCVPEEHRAEGLIKTLVGQGMSGKRVLLVRARDGRDILPDALRKAGATAEVLPVYETLSAAEDAAALRAELEAGHIRCVTFGSSSSVDNFFAALEPAVIRQAAPVFACIGPITAATLETYGLSCQIQPTEATIPALIQAVETYFNDRDETGA